jgi:uncharacterized protein
MENSMGLTPAQMDRKIDEHFGFEARDDVAGVLSTLAPDVLHDVVGWPGGPTHGRENARPFYETLFKDLADGQATCIRRLYAEKFLVDESIWRGRAVGRPFGLDGRGRPLEFRLLHVMEFSDEGQIERETVWADMAAITRQLAQG